MHEPKPLLSLTPSTPDIPQVPPGGPMSARDGRMAACAINRREAERVHHVLDRHMRRALGAPLMPQQRYVRGIQFFRP
jgi:hypothetical protein